MTGARRRGVNVHSFCSGIPDRQPRNHPGTGSIVADACDKFFAKRGMTSEQRRTRAQKEAQS